MNTRNDHLLAVAASVGGEIGYPFLEHVVLALREAMSADLVLITLGEGQPPHRARAIFALEGGMPAENIEYDLDKTPCALAYRGETVVIPIDLARRFPKEGAFEGYIGVPVRDIHGSVSGHFAVFSADPIVAPDVATSIVRIFGARIEGDARYRALIQERERLISDLVHTNEALRTRSQALHDANQFKTNLVGMIAHDLKNPLANLVGRAELLEIRIKRDGFDTLKALSDVETILETAERMAEMIQSTLSRCRAETDRIEIQRRRTDLTALARVAMETNRTEAERKSISLICPSVGEVWCEVDEGLCLEAVDNLVSNAVKYSSAGTCVEIRVAYSDKETTISVIDQGQGLTSDDIDKAFQPFQTLSAKPTGGERATGLGLSNVRQVAEAHGGRAWVESRGLGLGASFFMSLPQA